MDIDFDALKNYPPPWRHCGFGYIEDGEGKWVATVPDPERAEEMVRIFNQHHGMESEPGAVQ